MSTATGIPTVWNRLAEAMYLKDSPAAQVTLSETASFSFGRFQSREGLPEIARPLAGERGYIAVVQLKAIPFIEQFLANKKVTSGSYPVGAVNAIDLQDEPAVLLPNPFDALVLYITRAALDDVAYAHGMPRVARLSRPLGTLDPVIYHLAQTLLASLEQPHQTSRIFLDHVLHAMNCHFVSSYGEVTLSPPQFRGGLSPLQMRRATEVLEAHMDGNIELQQVAQACDLSVSHFAKAFKTTFRRPPYQWLTERRMDRARDLMASSTLSLADIAIQCGFSDQSALNRTFKRVYGVAPGRWRRKTSRGHRDPCRGIAGDLHPYLEP